MLAHDFRTHTCIVIDCVIAVDGDDGPCHNLAVDTCREYARMIRTKIADHIDIVAHRSGGEAIAVGGINHDLVVFGEISHRLRGLIGTSGGALPQRLTHVAAATLLHACKNRLIATGEVHIHGLVVRNGGKHRERAFEIPQVDTQEHNVFIAFAYVLNKQVTNLCFQLRGRLVKPSRTMNGPQIVVAMGFVIDERDECDRSAVLLHHIRTPRRASVNGVLIFGPHCGLFDGQGKTRLHSLLFHGGCVGEFKSDHDCWIVPYGW